MAATVGPALTLPAISRVDVADRRIGDFMGDLEKFRRQAETFASFVPLDDAYFLERAGIEVQEQRRHADPAIIARLLVFAVDVLEDADRIREDALALRGHLLAAYHQFVVERSSWREQEASDAD